MGISDFQKLDSLWKRVFYGLASTIVPPAKDYFNESIVSYTPTLNSYLWLDSDYIPTTAPGASTNIVKVWDSATPIQMTPDPTVLNNSTWLATSTFNQLNSVVGDWVHPGLDPTYLIKVYNGNPTLGGTSLNQTATDEEWIFDYASGVLRFVNNVPANLTELWLVGHQYTGRKGVHAATVVNSNADINLTQLTLGQFVFSKDDGTGQWILYMVSNLNPLVLTPITTQSGTPLATPDATLVRLITPTSPSIVTIGTFQAGTVVTDVEVDVLTAFDGDPNLMSLTIGDDQNQSSLMDYASIDLFTVDHYNTISNYNVPVNTQYRAYWNFGNSTQGVAEISITYLNKAVGTTGKTTTFIQNFDINTLSPLSLGVVQVGQTVLTTEIAVYTPFDGDPMVMSASIGTSIDPNRLLADISTDLSVADTYTNNSNETFAVSQEIFAYFDFAGSTTGFATIAITLTS